MNNRTLIIIIVVMFLMIGILGVVLFFLENQPPEVVTPPINRMSSLIESDAPDFERMMLEGETVRLSDWEGQMVILNFWATWCVPCRREMPAFQTYMENYTDGDPIILTVNDAEDPDTIQAFFDEIDVRDIPVMLDLESELQGVYGVFSLPTTYIIDAEGMIRAVKFGEVHLEDLEAYAETFGGTRYDS